MKTLLSVTATLLMMLNGRSQSSLTVDQISVNRLTIGNTAYFDVTNSILRCFDAIDGELLFQSDTTDPSFEVPGMFVVVGPFEAIGQAHFNAAIIVNITFPTNSTYLTRFEDSFIVIPPGVTNVILNPGYDGRLLTIKDGGLASTTNVTIVDIHGERFDGATSLKFTNDYASVSLIYNYKNNRWMVLSRYN